MRITTLLFFCVLLTSKGTVLAEGESQEDPERTRRSQIVVKGNGVRIRLGRIEDSINARPPRMREEFKDKKKTLELALEMGDAVLLAKEASRTGLDKSHDVERTIHQHTVQALIRRQYDEKFPAKDIPKKEVEAYYQAHIKDYQKPAMRRARHILLKDRKAAQTLLSELQGSDSATFARKAEEKSLDTESNQRGGDLRFFDDKGNPPLAQDAQVDKNLAKAAFALKEVGDLSKAPVPLGKNWSILMLTGVRPENRRSLKEVEKKIRMTIWRDARKARVESLVKKLRAENKTRVYPERLKWIKLEAPPKGGGLEGFPAGGRADSSDNSKKRSKDNAK